ncbi:MAG TPA: hypothetical protein ENI33_03035 [Thermoplasmatales archaeon]|nr:hypothetical protein [Thermoplasmatales archaeon]
MNKSESRRKYEWYRHHAWAGLGILSVFLAINYFISIPYLISLTFVLIISVYIVVSLILTYKYSASLSSEEIERTEAKADMEKELLKIEKKRIKAELKAKKKREKD